MKIQIISIACLAFFVWGCGSEHTEEFSEESVDKRMEEMKVFEGEIPAADMSQYTNPTIALVIIISNICALVHPVIDFNVEPS